METSKVYRFSARARFFNFDAQSFIIDVEAQSFYSLGVSSAVIATQLDGNNDLGRIVDVIRECFGASEVDSAAAVSKFIDMMKAKQLIEVLN